MQSASVVLYDPINKENALATGTTNNDGSFNLTLTQSLPKLRPLVLVVRGGLDTDPDDNPDTTNTPITNQGALHAIVFADDLLNPRSIIVSPVTEMIYQRFNEIMSSLPLEQIRPTLDNISSQLLSVDITGNNFTDYKDILAFDPSNMAMHTKLRVPFNKYHQKLSDGKSFIEALRDNDTNATRLGNELLGVNAPNIDLPQTNVASNIKLDIYVNGDGRLESALFKSGKWLNTDGTYSLSVPRSLKEEYAVTAIPSLGRKIVSWVGCSSISQDNKICLIKPNQSKSVYVVLEATPEFNKNIKDYKDIALNSDVLISDSAGIMTISTKDAKIGENLAKITESMALGLPYLPHPLVSVTQIVSLTKNVEGTIIRFKFVDKQLTDVLNKATFYYNSQYKPQFGLDDVISVTMINDKNVLKNAKFSPTDSNFKASTATNSQTPITPKFQDKSGGNHVGFKAWELVIHKDKCVIYADDTPPTTRPPLPSDTKNDTVWTSALRASEGECDNKVLIYKPYNQYKLDFQLTGTASLSNANHARFANMRFMQHMDKKSLANTPLYLISGNKKQGEMVRTAAAWTWASGVGPVLKVRKNVFLAPRGDGRSGFELLSFEDNYRPQGDLYNVSDFVCPSAKKCNLRQAQLPHIATSRQVTQNPWYFGPNDPIPSPYKQAVDTNNLFPLFTKDGLSIDFPFKNLPWLSAGVNARLGFGMSIDYLFDFDVPDVKAAFKLIPEVALEPRIEINLKAGQNSNDWTSPRTKKAALEMQLMSINLGTYVSGPVASILRPELVIATGIEFGGEAKLYAAYTHGIKAKFGIDAYYDKDANFSLTRGPYTTTTRRLDFPRSFETYKSAFEFGAEGQLYAEPYLDLRLQASVTGVGDNLANLGLRGFVNANIGFSAGAASPEKEIKLPSNEVQKEIDKINNQYALSLRQQLLYDVAINECYQQISYTPCAVVASEYVAPFDTIDKANQELKNKRLFLEFAPKELFDGQKAKIHTLYDKYYGSKFVDYVLDGVYTKDTKLECTVALSIGLDAGIRASANLNVSKIEFIGGFFNDVTVNLFEQRWPIQLKFIDDWNAKLSTCADPDVPQPNNIAENGSNSIDWKELPNSKTQYALIECGTWKECQAQAVRFGGQLVTINNEQTNQWLFDTFIKNTNKGAWIGINDVATEGKYRWQTLDAATYTNWNSGEPNNAGDEDAAVMINNGKWNDASINDTSTNRAIIEKASSTPVLANGQPIVWKTNPNNKTEYALINCEKWSQCQDVARRAGGYLASIFNDDENQWLFDTFIKNTNKGAWIGLNDSAEEGKYKWLNNDLSSYTQWNSGEPNNVGDEDVVVMVNNGNWNDASINDSSTNQAIIQKPRPAKDKDASIVWKFNPYSKAEYALVDCQGFVACAQKAQALGGYLASVFSQAENEWVVTNFLKGVAGRAWIGLNDFGSEGEFRWALNYADDGFRWVSGAKPTYTNWNSGEPNDAGSGEDTVVLLDTGKWNDANANESIGRAIIQKPSTVKQEELVWIPHPNKNYEYALTSCDSWTRCQDIAVGENSRLVFIESGADNDWLVQTFFKNGVNSVWIGLNDTAKEGEFKWVLTDNLFSYTNWNTGEPNNVGNEDAVAMIANGKWNDTSITDTNVGRAIMQRRYVHLPENQVKSDNNYAVVQCGSWQNCKKQAVALGQHLVTIDSAEENQLVYDLIKPRGANVWIGLSNIGYPNDNFPTFRWTFGDVFPNYENWDYAAGFPQRFFNRGVAMMAKDGKWQNLFEPETVNLAVFEALKLNWKYNDVTKHAYALITCTSWENCQQIAQSHSANLVTINNQAEEAWIKAQFGTSNKYWIGLTDKDVEGKWQWISGEAVSYLNWNNGEPNNVGEEDFAEMVENGKWNDANSNGRPTTLGLIETK